MLNLFPRFIFLLLLSNIVTTVFCQDTPTDLLSPDKKILIRFEVGSEDKKAENAHQLYYSVSLNGKWLLKQSLLSLNLKNYAPLGASVQIVNTKTSSADESYHLLAGKASDVRNQYNAIQIDLEETGAPKRKITIEAKAYNDAVAFRYVVPEQETTKDSFALKNENTEFHFSTDATTYAQVLPHYRSMYESEYLKLPVSAFSNQGGVNSHILIGLPLLAEVPGAGWLAIA